MIQRPSRRGAHNGGCVAWPGAAHARSGPSTISCPRADRLMLPRLRKASAAFILVPILVSLGRSAIRHSWLMRLPSAESRQAPRGAIGQPCAEAGPLGCLVAVYFSSLTLELPLTPTLASPAHGRVVQRAALAPWATRSAPTAGARVCVPNSLAVSGSHQAYEAPRTGVMVLLRSQGQRAAGHCTCKSPGALASTFLLRTNLEDCA